MSYTFHEEIQSHKVRAISYEPLNNMHYHLNVLLVATSTHVTEQEGSGLTVAAIVKLEVERV